MKKVKMLSKTMGSYSRRFSLVMRVGMFLLLFSSALLYGQFNNQGQGSYPGQTYNQNQPSNQGQGNSSQPYGQGQSYNHNPLSSQGQGQMQMPGQSSLGMNPNDPNNLTPMRIMQILRDNPDLANDVKLIVLQRLREEGRTPPGGQLTPAFVMTEIQNDSVLKSRLLQVFQQRGVIPAGASPAMGQGSSAFPGSTQGMQGGYGSNNGAAMPNGQQPSQMQQSQMQPSQMQPSQMQPSQLPQSEMAPGTQPLVFPPSTQPQLLMQPVPYGDLQSLRDLYTQVPDDTTDLKRFGMDVFLNGTGNTDLLPVDLPADGDYVLGSGDALNIHIWGGIEQELSETVDRTGRIDLPSTRSLMVATKTLAQAQEAIRNALAGQFKNTKVDVSLARVRTVRVYVVGDVQRPGGYDISSLSTPLNALLAAGGPTDQGSLRRVKHFRGSKLVGEVDLYDLLLNGVSKQLSRLESGDTLLVSPIGPQVTVAGMVRRPAIYEVNDGDDLAHIVDVAGGLQVSATVGRISIDRVEAYKRRVTLTLQIPEGADQSTMKNLLASFKVQDGDRVQVSSILPNREETVYVEGHVFRPGKRAFTKGMQISELIHSYQDVMPEPAEHAEIIRLMPPDYRPVVIEFKLSELLSGDDPIELQPFDTVRIFGRYDLDPPSVTINGEVLLPGQYPLAQKMTAAELVRMAGGFKRSASMGEADLSSYVVKNGVQVISEHKTVEISDAMNGNAAADVTLKPGDVVTVRQLAGWQDIGASVTLGGEVMHPGTYGIGVGEKLSNLLERAGGFRNTAFPEGANLERVQVQQLAAKSQAELIDRIETEGLGMSFAPPAAGSQDSAKDEQSMLQTVMAQQKEVVSSLKSHPPSGRLVINIGSDISKWKNTSADLELRDGDQLTIPKRSDLVMVNGQVYNPSAMSYVPGKNAEWYLRSAGGFTELANKHAMFIVRANGAVVTNGKGDRGRNKDVMSTRMKPGDMLISPEKIMGGSTAWRNLVGMAQVLSGLAITARVATSF
jgi:polysaccharide biosynthesis/export protein